jgi:hypothetical protein
MTKTPRVLFDTGQSTKSIGTANFRNSDTVCKVCLFFMYDQRPSVSNRDLATMVRAPHEGCYVHRIRRVRLHT